MSVTRFAPHCEQAQGSLQLQTAEILDAQTSQIQARQLRHLAGMNLTMHDQPAA